MNMRITYVKMSSCRTPDISWVHEPSSRCISRDGVIGVQVVKRLRDSSGNFVFYTVRTLGRL